MKQQHTPGPWSDDGFSSVAATQSDQLNNGYFVAECSGPDKFFNASLIAAAPDLLEQLINARNRLADMLKGDDGQAWQEAERAMPNIEAAINKALG